MPGISALGFHLKQILIWCRFLDYNSSLDYAVATLVKRLSSARRDNIWVHEVGKFLECRQFLQRSGAREHQPLLGNF